MKRRPTCASPKPRQYRPGKGPALTLEKASDRHAKAADAWRRRLVEWDWSRIYVGGNHCLYAVIEHGDSPEVVALVAWHPTPRKVGSRSATRLDFFEVMPTKRGSTLPRAALAFLARFCADLRRDALRVTPLPDAASFYTKLGAEAGSPKGWAAPKRLVALGFVDAKARRAREIRRCPRRRK